MLSSGFERGRELKSNQNAYLIIRNCIIAWIIGSAMLSTHIAYAQPTWQVFQLTNGSDLDAAPSVSGTTYVWQRKVGNGAKIMMWSEGDEAPVEISTTQKDWRPRIDNGKVIWSSNAGGDYELMYWENGVVTPLTNNTDDERLPVIGGFGKAWLFNTWYLIHDNGTTQTQISANLNNFIDEYPSVFDNWVVWESGGSNAEIYFWNNGKQIQLTNNGYEDHRPETDGNTIVWYAFNGPGGTGSSIFRWTQETGTMQITEDSQFGWQPDVSGDVVVFSGWDGNDQEIYLRYFGINYQITDNNFHDYEPSVDGNRIVWEGHETSGYDIYYAILGGLVGGDPPGACCLGMTCSYITETECINQSGAFKGQEIFCNIDSCPESVAPAQGWSTFQHDAQRTGRTNAIIPAPPVGIWNLFTSPTRPISPVIGPDGTIYVAAANDHLAAVNPDGSLRWDVNFSGEGAFASPAIRSDGYFFLARHSKLSKFNNNDGSEVCGISDVGRIAPVIDENGNCYFGGIRKIDPSCNVQWSYSGDGAPVFQVSLSHDGSVYTSIGFNLIKIDPNSGNELWKYPTPGMAGAPAIGLDDTAYLHHAPNILLAINPNGSEKWSYTLTGLRNGASAPSPAIGADGTVYISSNTWPELEPTLVAVSADGSEQWRFSEPINSGNDHPSPIIDGSGTILFPIRGGDLIALSPIDGSELWRIDLGDDFVNTSPAIGEDGTLYLTTNSGYLVAYGFDDCPEPDPQSPPFTYRQVVKENDLINGYTIGNLEEFDILENGRVTFKAFVASTGVSGVFTELPDGSFETIVRGTIIDGYEIDSVSLPRYDITGNRYLGTYLVDFGPAIFVNDILYVAEREEANPIALVNTIEYWQYVDPNNIGQLLTLIRHPGGSTALISVDTFSGKITELVSESQVIDDFLIDDFTLESFNSFGDNGIPVVQATNGFGAGGVAIITPSSILARTGDIIDGRTISFPRGPQQNNRGDVYYRNEGNIFKHSQEGVDEFVYGVGDTIAGHPVLDIYAFAINDVSDVAYGAVLLGSRGLFVNNQPVVISTVTQINGSDIINVGSESNSIKINTSGQIAFIAQLTGEPESLFVATSNHDFDMNQDNQVDGTDFAAFEDCITGQPGVLSQCECLQSFDSNGNTTVDCNDWNKFLDAWNASVSPPVFQPCIDSINPVPAMSDPTDISKNRYISLIPGNAGWEAAIRITLINLDKFPQFNNEIRWVGPPGIYGEGSGNNNVIFSAAQLQCVPYYQDWSAVGLLHIYDPAIVPNSEYKAQLIYEIFSDHLLDELAYSPALDVLTSHWGDVIEPFWSVENHGQPNINDVLSVVKKWLGTRFPIKVSAQLRPNVVDPDKDVSVDDVLATVNAWLSASYPLDGPSSCP